MEPPVSMTLEVQGKPLEFWFSLKYLLHNKKWDLVALTQIVRLTTITIINNSNYSQG